MKFETLVLELNKIAVALQTAKLSTATYEVYWEHFQGEVDEDFSRACAAAREHCDYFPTIKQLRAFLPDRRARAALEQTDRLIARQQLVGRKAWETWPRRIGPEDPTPVAELVGAWMEPPDEVH
jgi:hypothetical protein